ncbi:CCHC-type domain-containing protein [Nephila pilipes]|uniref:CCHC-type domain-containing protein n=1 Tax=Nephila pilipes TaxID=299642 RepID=A0A8X6UGQ6_NEPPI|nr:CCHC-type domain-containing protein [Nephila pilipes]
MVVLLDRGSWSFIDGTEPALDKEATSKEQRYYNLRKDRCYSEIFLNVEEDLQALISTTTSGEEAWTILKNHFEPITRARVAALLDEFFNARKEPDESIGVFVARVLRMVNMLKEAGHTVADEYQSYQLIRHLGVEFQLIVLAIFKWPNEHFKFDAVQAELLCEESLLQ